jgi:hypothetical protein
MGGNGVMVARIILLAICNVAMMFAGAFAVWGNPVGFFVCLGLAFVFGVARDVTMRLQIQAEAEHP